MKNKLKLWLLAACFLAGAGCDPCDDEGDNNRSTSMLGVLHFSLKENPEIDLFHPDTVYKNYILDSLRLIPIGDTPEATTVSNYHTIGDLTINVFEFELIQTLEKDRSYSYSYYIDYNNSDIDTITFTFTPDRLFHDKCENGKILDSIQMTSIVYNSDTNRTGIGTINIFK